jgi:hypothetical protein
MAGSSTVRSTVRLRPTTEADLDHVVAAEAAPDAAPFLAPSHDRARALYRSEGFVEEGVLRAALREPDGSFASLVVMGRLRPEWAP